MRVTDDSVLAYAFDTQAKACAKMGAPFTARVCQLLAEHLDDASALGRRVLAWPKDNWFPDLVPLRCCAAFHALARSHRVRALAAVYAPANADQAEIWPAFAEALAAHDAELTAYLDSAPQTNEVGRSAILLGGLLALAQTTPMPFALHEIGASAGLNLSFDRWAYDLGQGGTWGGPDAAVRLTCPWTGAMPSIRTPFEIASRAGSDLRPIHADEPADRERLLSYIWPDQPQRLARIAAALEIAAVSGPRVEQADAREWVAAKLASEEAEPGVARVLFHSVFLQYLGRGQRSALVADIREIGRKATRAAPFAWLRMEAGPDRAHCELRMNVWPAGENLALADVDWHGKSAHWH